MVGVAQLVRALDCGSRGRGFKSHLPPKISGFQPDFFILTISFRESFKKHSGNQSFSRQKTFQKKADQVLTYRELFTNFTSNKTVIQNI